ncbi:MAG: LamG domain-containing protein [Fibrobacterales bacterium]
MISTHRSSTLYFMISIIAMICLGVFTQCSTGVTPVDTADSNSEETSETPTYNLRSTVLEMNQLAETVYQLKEVANTATELSLQQRYDEVILIKVERLQQLMEQYNTAYDSIIAAKELEIAQYDSIEDKRIIDSLTVKIDEVRAFKTKEQAGVLFIEKFIAIEYERLVGATLSSSSVGKTPIEIISGPLDDPSKGLSSSEGGGGTPLSSVSVPAGNFSSSSSSSISSVSSSITITQSSIDTQPVSSVTAGTSSSHVLPPQVSSGGSSSIVMSSSVSSSETLIERSSALSSSSISIQSSAAQSSAIQISDPLEIVHFDGDPEYIDITGSMNPDWKVTGITMELWVKWDEFKNWTHLIHLSSGDDYGYMISMGLVYGPNNQSKQFKYVANNAATHNNGDDWAAAVVDSVFVLNTWQHVAVSVTPQGRITFYVDGMAVHSVEGGVEAVPNKVVRNKNYLGKGSKKWDGYFKGSMDNVRIWSGVRTAQEITDNMFLSTTTLADTVGLVLSYDFEYDALSPLVVVDKSVHGFDGALIDMIGQQGVNGTWRP